MKKTLTVVFAAALIVSMLACNKDNTASGSAGSSSKAVSVKFGNTQGEGDTQTMALREVAKRLNESGRFSVEVFPASSLGDTDDLTEQAMQGAAIVTVSDPTRLETFVHDYGIVQMPYILKDYTYLDKLNTIPSHKQWEAAFEKQGIKLVTSNWFSGTRHFVTNNIVNTPADLKGQRIRTLGNPIGIGTVNAMGGVGVGMPWGEVYPAIQQKSLDGAEVQTVSSYPTRLYEILKYTNKTGHFQLIGSVVTGAKFFNNLSKEDQELFIKTFRDVGSEFQQQTVRVSAEYEADMVAKGMIVRDVDPTPFVNAVVPLYDSLGYAQLRTKVLAELAN